MKRQAFDATSARPCDTRRRRGMIMPLVLIAMGIAMMLGLAFLSSASTAQATASSATSRLNARMIAESGIAVALAHIDSDPAWRSAFKKPAWVENQPLAGGTFNIEVEDGDQVDATGKVIGDNDLDDDNQDPVVITCIGVYGDSRHRVRAVRRVPAPTGIAVVERVSLRRNALIDSYDPAVPYSAATATSRAVASSNGIARRPYVLLYGKSRVNGNVYYGPGGSMISSVRRDASAVVTGSIGPLPAAVERLDVVEPPFSGVSAGDRSYSSGVTTLTSDAWYDELRLSGTAILRAVGNVKIRVDERLTMEDTARIQLGHPIAYAAATKGSISILDDADVDSFDSSIGPYGGTNVGAEATLATNSTTGGSVTLQLATVKGNVVTGVGSNPNLSVLKLGATLTGTATAMTTPLTIPAPPAWPTNVGSNIGNYDVAGNTTLAAHMYCERVRIEAGAVLTVSGHRVVRVVREFVLDGASRIDILPNSSLTVYVGERISIAAGSKANVNTGDASKLVIYGMASGLVHTINGANTAVCSVIDAPNSTLEISDSAHLFGAFMGNSLTVKVQGRLHADRNPALATACPRLPVTFTTGNKLTIYTHESLTISEDARVNAESATPLNVQFYHLGSEPMKVSGNAVGYAETYLRENTLEIYGSARWTGRIRSRDLIVSDNAIVTADASGGTSEPGIIVEETVELNDNAILNPAPDSGGSTLLASHGATDTTIRLEHTSVFKGDGYTTPGGYPNDEIRVAHTATFTGIKGALDIPVDITAPPAPPMVGTPSDRNYTGSGTTVLSGDVYADDFSARDSHTIEIDGVTRVILRGNFFFSRSAKLKLRPYAKLTVFCPGIAAFLDDSQVNLNGNPTQLVVACGGGSYRIVAVTGNAKFCGTLIAPPADLLLWDRAEFFGAYRGKRLTMDKDSKFHCSEDGPVPITWLEQQ